MKEDHVWAIAHKAASKMRMVLENCRESDCCNIAFAYWCLPGTGAKYSIVKVALRCGTVLYQGRTHPYSDCPVHVPDPFPAEKVFRFSVSELLSKLAETTDADIEFEESVSSIGVQG